MKVTEKQFLICLRKAFGNYSMCAKIIENEFNVTYTRQAVRDRAEKHPEEIDDIAEHSNDFAESIVVGIMRDGKTAVNLRAAEILLNAKASHRGWGNKTQIELKGNPFLELSSEERAEILKIEAAQIEMNKLNGAD